MTRLDMTQHLFIGTVMVQCLFCMAEENKKKVLLVGSTHSFSDEYLFSDKEYPFSPLHIGTELESLGLSVVTEDVFRSKKVDTNVGGGGALWRHKYELFSLAQYMFWPDGKDARRALLRGDVAHGGPWDYVILMHDPYILARMPGWFAEGVSLAVDEVRKGGATPLLLLQWPDSNSDFSLDHFSEVIYRVGEGAGIAVVPAGIAWDTYADKDMQLGKTHPTPRGAKLAAAAIYSEIFDESAVSAGFPDAALAKHALDVVLQERSITPHFSGHFIFQTPFSMRQVAEDRDLITFCHTGSSSEKGIQWALEKRISQASGIRLHKKHCDHTRPGDVIDFNLGRGNSRFEANKRYRLSSKWPQSFGFPMQDHKKSADTSFPYGFDRRWYSGYSDGTDLGICDDMIRQKEVSQGARCVPSHLLWAKMHEVDPSIPILRDNWHMSRELDVAIASFIFTVASGQCAIGEEPQERGSGDWKIWLARRTGAETAWRFSTLQMRGMCSSTIMTTTAGDIATTSTTRIVVTSMTTTLSTTRLVVSNMTTTHMRETTTATTRTGSYYMMPKGSCCCLAEERVQTKSDCEKAHDALGLGRNVPWTGVTGNIPGGCSTRQDRSHNLHWNALELGKSRSDMTPICRKFATTVTTTTTAATTMFPAQIFLWKVGQECLPNGAAYEENLGKQSSLENCQSACIAKGGSLCNYFIFGKDNKVGECWWEYDVACETGQFEADAYNIYRRMEAMTTLTTSTFPHTTAASSTLEIGIHSGETVFLKTFAGKGKHIDIEGAAVNARWEFQGDWQAITIEKNGNDAQTIQAGDVVYLKAHTGMHIDVSRGQVEARWNDHGAWQAMIIEEKFGRAGAILPNDLVCFKSQNTGMHLHVEDQDIRATWNDCGDWQTILIQKGRQTKRAISSGDLVHLVAHTGKLLDVESSLATARWSERGFWQTFTIESYARQISSGDEIFLRAHTGNVIDVQGVNVQASWNDNGSWQRLVISKPGGGAIMLGDRIFLQAHTGNFIEVNDQYEVHARWSERGTWQTFVLEGSMAPRRLTNANLNATHGSVGFRANFQSFSVVV